MRLIDKLEQDDVLIVTKLDRLGRNATQFACRLASGHAPTMLSYEHLRCDLLARVTACSAAYTAGA